MVLLAQLQPASAQNEIAPVLRGRALEIVDSQGRPRATIVTHGPTTVDNVKYPEAVVFRLIAPNGGPYVKMDTSEEGAGLGITDPSEQGGLRLMSKSRTGTFIQVTDRTGAKQIIKP